MTRRLLSITAALMLAAAPAWPHHAIASIYDSSNPITIEGTVVDFQFVNPHPFLLIQAGAETAERAWRLDMDNRFELVGIGMSAGTFRKGDRIVVTGGPARDRSRSLYVRRLERPADGLWYEQAGSSPTMGGPRTAPTGRQR